MLRRHPITEEPRAVISLQEPSSAALPGALKRAAQQRLIALPGFRQPFLCQRRQRLACADGGAQPARAQGVNAEGGGGGGGAEGGADEQAKKPIISCEKEVGG